MSLANDYRRQSAWRDWPAAFEVLPNLEGKTILDLGCGVGDQAAELVTHGARVIGVDGNDDLLKVARSLGLPTDKADFRKHDLHALPDLGERIDGIWCSFTTAYFVDLDRALAGWRANLVPGGFIAVTEVDDLFAHEPIADETKAILEGYAAEAKALKRYDFHMGGRVREVLESAGFVVTEERFLEDAELAFAGPASPDIIEAWGSRFDRLPHLRQFAGDKFDEIREDFLRGLASSEHRSNSRIHFCLATS